jgi:AcrR family transcriptional regulator
MNNSRQGGRPRSEATRKAILSAAYELLKSTDIRSVSMDKIAEKAGASKATLYRWWSSKSVLLLDAINAQPQRYPRFSDTGNTYRDILNEIKDVIDFYTTVAGGAMLDLISESRYDQKLAESIRDLFVSGRRADAIDAFTKGIERGEIKPDVDFEVVLDAIWGAIYYRLLVYQMPMTKDYTDRLLSTIWSSLVVESEFSSKTAKRD